MTTPPRSPLRNTPLRPALRLLVLGLLVPLALAVWGCRVEPGEGNTAGGGADPSGDARGVGTGASPGHAELAATLERATALADSIEDQLRPVPLMRPADEEALRRYSNADNVRVARELGARPGDTAELRAFVASGRLVRLEDSTAHWVVRELNASQPYVTPDTRALLVRLGTAFQERLADMGLPPYRLEISSVLRTPADQAGLRDRNVNAAAGTSSHEFGTTVDIAYEAYAAPAELPEGLGGPGDLLGQVSRLALERVAARKSRELTKVLGEVMAEAQGRGEVLVTLERQQPVYHITVARRGG